MDGGAVLMNPTTAIVDACFSGNDSLAAFVRNTVGRGRVAWATCNYVPSAHEDASGFSTDKHELYLEALYAWLDQDGPEGN